MTCLLLFSICRDLVERYGTRAWTRVAAELGTGRPAAAVLQHWVREFQRTPAALSTTPAAAAAGGGGGGGVLETPGGGAAVGVGSAATGAAGHNRYTPRRPRRREKGIQLDEALQRRLVFLVEQQHGAQWEVVGEKMRMAPEVVQQHYEAINHRRKLKEGCWTPGEDVCLLQAVERVGRQWSKVARLLPGRTAKQCKGRYNNNLRPGLVMTPFTQGDAVKLKEVRIA